MFYNNFLFKSADFDMNSRSIANTEITKFGSERLINTINKTDKNIGNNNGDNYNQNHNYNDQINQNKNSDEINQNTKKRLYNNLKKNNKESEKLMYSSQSSNNTIINNNNKKLNESIGDISINMSTDSINVNSYRNAILSDYIKTLKIGHLIPIDCGHNGSYNPAELDLYSFYLLNSNLLN